jgi:hypothetical protein
MSISNTTLLASADYFSTKGQSIVDSNDNAANSLRIDPKTTLTVKLPVTFVAGTVITEEVALYLFKKGADVIWQDISAVVDANTTGLTGALGFYDSAGAFTEVALLGTHTGNVCNTTVEAYADTTLTEDSWLVLKLEGTPPVSGTAAIYVPFIVTA